MTAKNSKLNKICYALYSIGNYKFNRNLGPNCGYNLQIYIIYINMHVYYYIYVCIYVG